MPDGLQSGVRLEELSRDHLPEAVEVLAEAFHDYPVMRYILDPPGDDYDARLLELVDYFTAVRFYRNDVVLGAVGESDEILAVANIALPVAEDYEPPAELVEHQDRVWRELGEEPRRRYEAYGAAVPDLAGGRPHHHLSMIGVRRSAAGTGLGGRLLHALHDLAGKDPDSSGCSLTTENPKNVTLYRHFGYEIVGECGDIPDFRIWAFFRENESI